MATLTESSMNEDGCPKTRRGPRPVTLKPVDESDKPRHVYRIRKSDYVKLPPIEPKLKDDRSICDRVDEDLLLEEHMLDIERYVKDLLPDLPSHPAAVRTTLRSPQPTMVSETDLALWREGRGRRRGQGAPLDRKSHLPISCLYRLGQALLTEQQMNLNRDLLEKEVQIKRILEQHRPILLRSLRNWRFLGKRSLADRALEVAGIGQNDANTDSPGGSFLGSTSANRCSTARDSALGDSGFGLWEGSHDQDTDYLPSQRTLVTGEQERSTVLHSLTEGELKEDSLDATEPKAMAEDYDSDGDADNEDDDDSSDDEDTPLPFPAFGNWKETTRTPSTMTTTSSSPHQSTPVTAFGTTQESIRIPSPEPDSQPTPSSQLHSRESQRSQQSQHSTVPVVHSAASEELRRPLNGSDPSPSSKNSRTELSVKAPSDDILGINAMLESTDDEQKEDEEKWGEEEEAGSDLEAKWSSEGSLSSTEDEYTVDSPPPVYVYKPKPKTPTPTPPPPPPPPPPPKVKTPTPPPPPELPPPPPVLKRILPKPPAKVTVKQLADEEFIRAKIAEAAERAKQRAIEKAREKELEMEMESQLSEEFSGDESVHEILQRFTIVDKSRLNYLHKIFHDYQSDDQHPYLSHQEMKRALSQIKSCTKITRKQLKFIELLLGLRKERISFHTFAVMATLIDHMSHKDPSTLAMFDSIDLTRLQHDLPRLKRLFHCVSERDEMGWPKLTTKAMEIELRAACVPEQTRLTLIKELDPDDVGEITIFDFILFTPFWIYLHDGIVDNPFREIEREVTSPVHRKWGVSVLWLPEHPQNAREPRASPASGCGSERSTPPLYIESPKMRNVQGEPDYSEEEEDEEGIVNSDDED